MSNVMSDANHGYGMYFDSDGSSRMSDIKLDNLTLKGGGTSTYGIGTSLDANAYSVKFNNLTVSEYLNHGVDIASNLFRFVEFNNGSVYNNNLSAGGYSGYNFQANTRDIKVIGGRSGGGAIPSAAGTQDYGMVFSTGHSNIVVSNVDLATNSLGSVSGGTSGVKFYNCESQDSTSVASAATVTLPVIGKFFTITGTTPITSLTASWKHRRVTLSFADALTFTDGSNLKLAGNFTTTADDTITLVSDGANWIEQSRSVN
jgi:hypothetical protein